MSELKDIIRQTKAHFCLDCGKCTAVCPVSRYDQQFSPRLIVRKALRHPEKIYADRNIWSCIGCNMCTIRCNYNVSFVDFIRYLRMKSREHGMEPVYNHSGVTESVMHLMGKKETRQDRLDWIPQDINVSPSADTAFFVGCAPYFDSIFKDIGVKSTDSPIGAMRLLNRAGVAFTVLANERCCGHDLILSGDKSGFINLGQANIHEINKRSIKKIITACPECYYTLKIDYARFFPDWHMEVQHLAEVPDIIKIEVNVGEKGRNRPKVTLHDSCKLGRYFRKYDEPRNILRTLADAELIEMEYNRDNALCCGANPWMFCGSVNKQIQDERLRQADATGADFLITSCPKCQIHLTCAQRSNGQAEEKIKIVDMYHFISERALKEND
ncbi:MAG: (Fe-S)-binding protein [Dehalococcoidia bacterium]